MVEVAFLKIYQNLMKTLDIGLMHTPHQQYQEIFIMSLISIKWPERDVLVKLL